MARKTKKACDCRKQAGRIVRAPLTSSTYSDKGKISWKPKFADPGELGPPSAINIKLYRVTVSIGVLP